MTMVLEPMEGRAAIRKKAGRDASIISRAVAGELPEMIARDMQLSLPTVRSVLKRARERGVQVPTVSETRKLRDAMMTQLACQGMQPRDIADRIGLERFEVTSRLSKLRKNDVSIPKAKMGRDPSRATRKQQQHSLEMTPEIVASVRDLQDRGFRASAIAAKLRLPYAVVDAAMNGMGAAE
ncbi:MAG TPA: hypothetical protein VNX29_01905 [Kaistia sp.]|nr:hypothetical protein [Kaistia sp.]